ncbi:MAG: mannan-binding lectin [Desulfovibrio sp.]|jgi:hypothetical protein|nr:hypothetical protein [Desulfovibrio desulfuricans]MBO6171317.1 mannan-binding lectin [Desulfovibrio sp.]
MKLFMLCGALLTFFLLFTGVSLLQLHRATQWRSIDVEAGPIWSNDHAQERCPLVLAAWLEANPGKQAEWTGHWTTTVECEMSVCNFRIKNR